MLVSSLNVIPTRQSRTIRFGSPLAGFNSTTQTGGPLMRRPRLLESPMQTLHSGVSHLPPSTATSSVILAQGAFSSPETVPRC